MTQIVSQMSEAQLREAETPTPANMDELNNYINSLVNRDHDYGTCVYAMSMAATATFNYVAFKLGVTGFQAGCADLDILRRTRHMDSPFMVVDGSKMLYPQYDLHSELAEFMDRHRGWAAEQAEKKLTSCEGIATPNVIAHWERLAKGAQTGGDQT